MGQKSKYLYIGDPSAVLHFNDLKKDLKRFSIAKITLVYGNLCSARKPPHSKFNEELSKSFPIRFQSHPVVTEVTSMNDIKTVLRTYQLSMADPNEVQTNRGHTITTLF